MGSDIQLMLFGFVSTMVMLVISWWMIRLQRSHAFIGGSWGAFVLLLSLGIYGMTNLDVAQESYSDAYNRPSEMNKMVVLTDPVHSVAHMESIPGVASTSSGRFWPFLFFEILVTIFFAAAVLAALLGESKERSRIYSCQLADSLQQRINAESEIMQTQKTKKYFLANMSHEIRTPLNAIVGLSEVLDMRYKNFGTSDDREYNREIFEIIRRNSNALVEIIDNLLLYSTLETSQVPVRFSCFDFRDFIGRIDAELQRKYIVDTDKRRSLNTRVEFGEHFPVRLVADAMNLKSLLVNVWENAIKHTRQGLVLVQCYVEDFRENRNPNVIWEPQRWNSDKHPGSTRAIVSVSIQDYGTGIAPGEWEKIFEPFYQIDSSFTRTHGGLGLGLAISRKLARVLDGDITVASEMGKGSRFTVSFPALVFPPKQISFAYEEKFPSRRRISCEC